LGKFVIYGGTPLSGKVKVQGSKNSALPILAATILAEGTHHIIDVPNLLDIEVMIKILQSLGLQVDFVENRITVNTETIKSTEVPAELMGLMRSSIFLMGPLLAKFQSVTLSKPGGCAIGERKIDLHLKGLKALGANIIEEEEEIRCTAKELYGAKIVLDFPSVGATENIMMAATMAIGETKIVNAAKEPEIIDLQNFLNKMGAQITGAGTEVITIRGVKELNPVTHTVIPDRIVAGTLIVAAAITSGEVEVENVIPEHINSVLYYLKTIGVEFDRYNDIIKVKKHNGKFNAIDKIITAPFPGFPTDMQAQLMTLLTLSKGESVINEDVFDSRFKHVNELNKMGANIRINQRLAHIYGVESLNGAEVNATDLRAGAALVLAGLAAKGKTIVNEIHHIDRGYENIEKVLKSIGANITRDI